MEQVLPEQKWYEFDSSNEASYNCSVENYMQYSSSSLPPTVMGKKKSCLQKRLEERTSQENRLDKKNTLPKEVEKKTTPYQRRFEKEP